MFIGILLLIIGVLMLLDRTGLINIHASVINIYVGEFIVPAILVALGISMISKGRKSKK